MPEYPLIFRTIAHNAVLIPNKIAIIEAETDRKCTYAELWAYIKEFSKYLNTSAEVVHNFGDGYGTRVVVRCTQTIDFIVAFLAIQLAGGVAVPIEKNIADARIIEIMEETDSSILISAFPLTNYKCTFIPLYYATKEHNNIDDTIITFPDLNALAVILFTTGTTGKSKGVMHSHKSFSIRSKYIFSIFNHDNEQIWLIPNPLSHVNGLFRIYITFLSGCTSVLLDGYLFSKAFFSAVEQYKVTILNLLFAATEMYLRMFKKALIEIHNQINYICLSSSSFSEAQIIALREIFPTSQIIELYGSTEAWGCFIDHSSQKNSSSCIGQSGPGARVAFYNEEKNKIINTSAQNPGLFALSSDANMMGYWKNPELTSSVIRDSYIILSDLGYQGEDGQFYFIGRADDVITSGSYKISPLEIEEVANSFDGIRESACIAVKDPIMGQVPKLYVVMEKSNIFNYAEIYNFLKNKLEVTKIPRYIEEISVIPKINNKINRKELKLEKGY